MGVYFESGDSFCVDFLFWLVHIGILSIVTFQNYSRSNIWQIAYYINQWDNKNVKHEFGRPAEIT